MSDRIDRDRHGIAVFAAKTVGERCLRFMIERGDPVRVLVVGSASDRGLLEWSMDRRPELREPGRCGVFDAGTAERLAGSGMRFTWLVNLWCPHILGGEVLGLARHRLNAHPSLVPRARGNDNAAWILRKGLRAGVSLIEMTREVDAGDVWAQREVAVSFPMRGRELHERLQEELVGLFVERWPSILSGEVRARPQTGEVTSFRRRDTEADRVRDGGERMRLEEAVGWMLAHDFARSDTPEDPGGTTAEVVIDGVRYGVRVTLRRRG